MTKEKTIPIEKILFDKPILKVKALKLLRKLGIKTAQELAQYHPDDFEGACYYVRDNDGNLSLRKHGVEGVKAVGRKTIEYLGKCLQRAGLGFIDAKRVRTSAIDRYGLGNAEKLVLTILRNFSKNNTDYFTCEYIRREAVLCADRCSEREQARVFSRKNLVNMLEGNLSPHIDKVDIYIGEHWRNDYITAYRARTQDK